jgi:putative membrane protein
MNVLSQLVSRITDGYDTKKESIRKFRRTIYGAIDWRRHRSSSRHLMEVINMKNSQILRGIFPQSFCVTIFALFIYVYNRLVEKSVNKFVQTYFPLLAFPPLPFSLTSPSLGLLLVFRTNAAYSRWRDARIAWASISSKSFNLMRQGFSYFTDRKLIADLLKYTIVFSYALQWHLGQRSDPESLKEDIGNLLSLAELEDFLKAKNKPQKAILEITSIIKRADLISSIQGHMDKGICEMADAFYVCDRIYTTPIPLFYTRHTARFLLIWLLTVPMALYQEFKYSKWALIPISTLNALFLFGIEELGVQIEEPFSILPLGNICNEIRNTGEDILKMASLRWNGESTS